MSLIPVFLEFYLENYQFLNLKLVRHDLQVDFFNFDDKMESLNFLSEKPADSWLDFYLNPERIDQRFIGSETGKKIIF